MTKFQVNVTAPGMKVLSLCKCLRVVGNLGLRDAKNLSDYLRANTPCVLVAGVDREVAEHAAGLLREAGAEVVVQESSIGVPMLLRPEANQRYRWNWFCGPKPV